MSQFNLALPYVLKNEGGVYSNKLTGELSNRGISKKFLISIDYPQNDPRLLTTGEIHDLYKKYFWDFYRLGEIENQNVATKCFDILVNITPLAAIRCIQNAINSTLVTLENVSLIAVDGILGSQTLSALNKVNPTVFLANLIVNLEGYYKLIAIGFNAPNLPGWLARAREIPT